MTVSEPILHELLPSIVPTPEDEVVSNSRPPQGEGLWIDGLPVVMDVSRQLEDLIDQSFHGDAFFAPQPVANRLWDRRSLPTTSYGSPGEIFPGHVQIQERPALRLNQLYWPNGASRWSEMFVVMAWDDMRSLVRQTWQDSDFGRAWRSWVPAYTGVRPACVELYYPQPEHSQAYWARRLPLYVESVRVLGNDNIFGNSPSTAFALVHLVDVRFYWQHIGFGCSPSGRPVATAAPDPFYCLPRRGRETPVTWELLLQEIADQLQTYISYHDHEWNYDPSPDEFCRPGVNVAHLLDAIAVTLGARVIKQPSSVELSTATRAFLSQGDVEVTGYAGQGMFGANGPPAFDHLLVLYPKCIDGHVVTCGEKYYWQLLPWTGKCDREDLDGQTPVDASSAWTSAAPQGIPGYTHVVYSACHADLRGTDTAPSNLSTLQNMTREIMSQAATWHYAQFEGSVERLGVEFQSPPGNCDYALFNFGVEDSPRYVLTANGEPRAARGTQPQTSAPPELLKVCDRRLSTIFIQCRQPAPQVNLSYDNRVPIVLEPYFKIVDAYDADRLVPGGWAYGDWVVWDADTEDWVLGTAVATDSKLQEVKIYDQQFHACALVDEVVHCRWSDERDRWEVDVPHGLSRKGKVTAAAGIPADDSGAVEIYKLGEATGVQVTAYLDWMHDGVGVSQNKEVHILYDTPEQRWWIPGAQCED